MKKLTTGDWIAWGSGLLALIGFYAVLEFLAGDSLSKWAPIYLAGAAGGLCFELIRNRWRLELPSHKPGAARGTEASFAPFGPLVDVGFLGRMTTGAVAAPTFVAMVDALSATTEQSADLTGYLTGVAGRPDTIAWGVAVGFAAPAVWSVIEGFVKARGAIADSQIEIMQKTVEVALAKVKTAQTATATPVRPGTNGKGHDDEAATVVHPSLVEAQAALEAVLPPAAK